MTLMLHLCPSHKPPSQLPHFAPTAGCCHSLLLCHPAATAVQGLCSQPGTVSLKNVLCLRQFVPLSYKCSHPCLANFFVFQIKQRAPACFALQCKYASLPFLPDFSVGSVKRVKSVYSFFLRLQKSLNTFIRCSRAH